MKHKIRFGLATCMATAALALGAAPAVAAPGGYGPQVPTGPNGTPGGYTTVVYAHTFDTAGGTTGVSLGGAQLSIKVPAGAFSTPIQIEVTSADVPAVNTAVNGLGFAGYQTAQAFGIKVLDAQGQPLGGTFAAPITLVLSGQNLGLAGEKVLMFTAANTLRELPSTISAGSVSVQLDADPDLVVANPVQPAGSASIVSGTTTHTGKPFRGELALAGLMGLGAMGLAGTALRRRSRRQPAS